MYYNIDVRNNKNNRKKSNTYNNNKVNNKQIFDRSPQVRLYFISLRVLNEKFIFKLIFIKQFLQYIIMSIASFRGLCMKFGCKAYLLANTSSRIYFPTAGRIACYSSENNLYLMVKKRTLEARTKLQHNKLPKNKCYADTKSTSSSSAQTVPACPPYKQEKQADVCQNTQVLRAAGCNVPNQPKHKADMSTNQKLKIGDSNRCAADIQKPTKPKCPDVVEKMDKLDKMDKICGVAPRPTKPNCPRQDDTYSETLISDDEVGKCIKEGRENVSGGGSGDSGSDRGGGRRRREGGGLTEHQKNILIYALAAVASGGLLLWLYRRGTRNKKQEITSEMCTEAMLSLPKKIPASSSLLPKHVPYLLIGSGTAAFSAFRAIKSHEPCAKILMLTNEFHKPYMRPPLSKELWYSASQQEVGKDYRFKQWTGAERSLYFEPDEFFVHPEKLIEMANGGLAVAQGYTVKKIDPKKRIVTLTDGYEIAYDECLIATGCSPKNLAVFTNAPESVREKVMVYRTPDDFERLKRYIDEKKSITIVGNGFIGSELACSLACYSREKGTKICQVYQETGNMSKVLPDYLSKWTTRKVEAMGVCVYPNARVREAHRDETALKLTLNNGTTLLTDIVVVCVGCSPNTSIANLSGLEVDRALGGFLVNAELEARRNLFVAGDASCFYDPLLGRRRVEHHDHSVVSGRLAGENMVGKKKPYTHQSMFWSDLGPEIGYEAIGLIDASLPTVGVFALPAKADRRTDNLTGTEATITEKEVDTTSVPDIKCDSASDYYGRGVIFYLRDNKIVGILLWNLFNRIGLARTVITQNKKYDDLNEVAKLFEIHS